MINFFTNKINYKTKNNFTDLLFTKFLFGSVGCKRVNSALANIDQPGESFSGSHLRKRLNVPPSL